MKLLIVDRDGVVSRDPDGRTARPEDWQSVPGSAEAIARLNHGGYRVAVMADRGPLARGACDMATLNAMHARMIDEIAERGGRIEAVLFVPPAGVPGREDRIAEALGELLSRMDGAPASTVVVADTRSDLDAAHAAGCRTVLVLSGHGRATLDAAGMPPGTVVRVDLAAVAAELAP
ncbi:MAG TPA: HAD-IIIA family hydrolase [Burkholderiaceae bacterium]|nr:HAD-IIIA family hydrolase [Burkholderiaceae bacterium]